MTERLHVPFSLSCIGEGNGNPLQGSWLENPRDRGTCWVPSMGSQRVEHDWRNLAAQSQINKTSITINIFFWFFFFLGGGWWCSSWSLEYIPLKLFNKIYFNITQRTLCMFMPPTIYTFRFIYLIFILLFRIFFKIWLVHKIFT